MRCRLYAAGGTSTLLDTQTVPIISDGAQGITGYNTATILLYQRAASQPTKPSSDLTYTFSTHTFTESLGN